MQPRILIGTARVPGGAELTLYQRGKDFMIVLDRNELMSSRMSGSEEALANMTCERLRGRTSLHLLIGGYGMGFTLRAALAGLDGTARVTVAELVPEIIDWARTPMAELAAGCLDDPRVHLVQEDVADVIAAGRGQYDAILLDVDNGPGRARASGERPPLFGGRYFGGHRRTSSRAAFWRSGRLRQMLPLPVACRERDWRSMRSGCGPAAMARARSTSSGSFRRPDDRNWWKIYPQFRSPDLSKGCLFLQRPKKEERSFDDLRTNGFLEGSAFFEASSLV